MASPLPPDPYKILGLTKDAQSADIRTAHRKLVLKCHPDKVQDPALKVTKQDEFQKVQQAYELLSDDSRRLQYDEQVKLFELRREMGRSGPPGFREYEVRTAEPRTNPYARPPPMRASSKVYPQPRRSSYEDLYGEPLRSTPKKSASYESTERKSSRKDREREEERIRDERIREERLRELKRQEDEERVRAKYEKEARRAHLERKKARDKEERRNREEKQSRKTAAYVEDDSEDDYRPPKSEKKSSRHKMEEAARAGERGRQELMTPKAYAHKEYAAQYMQAARRKDQKDDDFRPAPPRRAETFGGPASHKAYTAPPPEQFSDDESPRRSSAHKAARKASPPTRTREEPKKPSKESRRKSPGAANTQDPYIVEPPSPPPTKPKLHSHTSAPPVYPNARKEPSRSKTAEYPRVDPGHPPPLPRAATFQAGDRGHGHHSGSRLKTPVEYDSDESDSDSPAYKPQRRSHSPPPRRREPEPTRYIIDNGRSHPVGHRSHRPEMRHIDEDDPFSPRDRSESPRGGRDRPSLARNSGSGGSRQAHGRSFSSPYHAAEEPVVIPVRPKMAPRESGSHRSTKAGMHFEDVKIQPNYGPEDVMYGAEPYRRGSDPSHHRDYSYPTHRGERPVYA